MTAPRTISGIWPAALTPLDKEHAPDAAGLAAHCRRLLAQGCDGVAVLGTTGEANSFTVDERLNLLDTLAAAGLPGRALLVGTGCCALPDTVRLTRKALEIGAAGALVLPPFYYKNVSDDGLFAAYAEIIERVGDDRLRLLLYHFPAMSGVPVPLAVIRRLAAAYPQVVAGIKDSAADLPFMTTLAAEFPGFAVMSGSDRLLLPLLQAGGAGAITAVTNIGAPLAVQLLAAFRAGQEAGTAQERLSALRALLEGYPAIAAMKALLARASGDPGWNRVRPPLMPLAPQRAEMLAAALAAAGFALSGEG